MKATLELQSGPNDGKAVFREKKTCSHTLFYMLNREFGHLKPLEERAADTLAGGILQEGHQCGMLWGASLAIGAEAYRRCDNLDQAVQVAIVATQQVMHSFEKREGTIDCRTITHCDFNNKLSLAKYMLSGRYRHCFDLAQEWAPEAVQAATASLLCEPAWYPSPSMSCATEVARQMGASDEEMILVAGFAGGLGLSGATCGALAAAVWLKALRWCREADGSPIKNPYSRKTLEAFQAVTNGVNRCDKLTGRRFKNLDEHSQYLRQGGCKPLLDTLAAN